MAYDAMYIEWGVSRDGIPIEQFVICPVWTIDKSAFHLSSQGMNIVPRMSEGKHMTDPDGRPIYDVFDIIGRKHYPYKTDFFEEAKRFGISRRWPTNTPIDKLTPGVSRHYLCTDAGALQDIGLVLGQVNHNHRKCLRPVSKHPKPFDEGFRDTCSAMWWSEIPISECVNSESGYGRIRPSFSYTCEPVLDKEPKFDFGAFMWLPLKGFMGTMTKDKKVSDELEKVLDAMKKAGFTTQVIDIDKEIY